MKCLKIDNGDEKEEEVKEKAEEEEEDEITKGNRRILRCPTVSP